ncbi:hypothetical protein [Streptomyces phage phiScoe1]|nr:hypothetical protein [Streptomyces phage phiScoe1]
MGAYENPPDVVQPGLRPGADEERSGLKKRKQQDPSLLRVD